MVFIDDVFVLEADRIGEEGKGFSYLLDSLNPERVLDRGRGDRNKQDVRSVALPAMPANGMSSAGRSARTREFSTSRRALDSAGGRLVDGHEGSRSLRSWQPCGAEANGAKFLGARAGYDACLQAVMTHGGMGYAKEYQVERLLREVLVTRPAPISEQLILSYIAERVLDQPKIVLTELVRCRLARLTPRPTLFCRPPV